MSSHHWTGSKTSLAFACQYWCREDVVIPKEDSLAAMVGNAFHEAAELTIKLVDVMPALEPIAAKWCLSAEETGLFLDLYAAWCHSVKRGTFWRPEVTYAYYPDTDTAKEVGLSLGRDYPKDGKAIYSTADVMYWNNDIAIVRDWKTGAAHNLPAASESGQLKILALSVARTFGVSCVKASLDHISKDGVNSDWVEFDVFDLDDIAAEIKETYNAIPYADPNPGTHCTKLYCPIRNSCPGRVSIMRRDDSSLATALQRGINTAEDVASCYDKLITIESLCEVARAKVREVTKRGFVDLGGGRRLAIHEQQGRESIDVKLLTELAKSKGATDEELAACKRIGPSFDVMRESKARKPKKAEMPK